MNEYATLVSILNNTMELCFYSVHFRKIEAQLQVILGKFSIKQRNIDRVREAAKKVPNFCLV